MTLKIYGVAASRAIRPLWAAEELGIPYEHIPVHYQDTAALNAPAFRALNPNGTVPAIDDHGLVLFESLAITLHLARTRPEGGLWAASAAGPSQILQWTLWAATEIEPLARQVAERLREQIMNQSIEIDGHSLTVTVSSGSQDDLGVFATWLCSCAAVRVSHFSGRAPKRFSKAMENLM